MGERRDLEDTPDSLAELRGLMNLSTHATLRCNGGDEEWFSDDPRAPQARAALCRACFLPQVCDAYATPAGEKKAGLGSHHSRIASSYLAEGSMPPPAGFTAAEARYGGRSGHL